MNGCLRLVNSTKWMNRDREVTIKFSPSFDNKRVLTGILGVKTDKKRNDNDNGNGNDTALIINTYTKWFYNQM